MESYAPKSRQKLKQVWPFNKQFLFGYLVRSSIYFFNEQSQDNAYFYTIRVEQIENNSRPEFNLPTFHRSSTCLAMPTQKS
jgi:hypothetical protein